MKTPIVSAVLAALVLSLSSAVYAQSDSSTVAAARAIGTEGLRLAESGNCTEAIDRLERAEKLYHAPTTQTRLGMCYIETGRLVQGLEHLRKVVREQLPLEAPMAFVNAKSRAQRVLEENQGRVAQLNLEVNTTTEVTPEVKIDGVSMPAALLGADRPTDPGAHSVEVTAPGHLPASAEVSVAEGERKALVFSLDPDLTPHAAEAAASPSTASDTAEAAANPSQAAQLQQQPQEHGSNLARVAGWSLITVGGVGLVTGAVASIIGFSKKSSLDDACGSDKVCPSSQRDNLDQLETASTIGTIGYAVGAAGLVSGAALLLLAPSSKPEARTAAPSIQPGLGSLTLRGTF